jgi:hypothetical protein
MTLARRAFWTWAVVLAIVAGAACGGSGDDDGSAGDTTPEAGGMTSVAGGAGDDATDEADDEASPTPHGSSSDDVSVSADPGSAVVVLDGDTLVYEASGSLSYTCRIEGERAAVNFQTSEGHDFLLQAAIVDGEWVGNATLAPGGENVRYSISLQTDGEFRVGEGVLTFDGTSTFTEIGDELDTARDVDTSMEVNCASPTGGEDASAEIDGETYVFPADGAQSYDCEVADDQFSVTINRLGRDNMQLSLDARQDEGAGGWLGNVTVIVDDDTYISTIPADGTGLTIEGKSISYTGDFERRTRGDSSQQPADIPGSAMVTCP